MIGKCLVLDSLMEIVIKPDGSANCSRGKSIEEVRVQLELASNYFNQCQNRTLDKKCNYGIIANEFAEANLLLGRLTDKEKFVAIAFHHFLHRDGNQNANVVGNLECLNWMIHHSNLRIESNLSKVMRGMKNLFKIFSKLIPLSIPSTNTKKRKKDPILIDFGVKIEMNTYFYNPIHKPRILEVLKNNQDIAICKTAVKTVIYDIPAMYDMILRHLLTKSNVWFCKIKNVIEEELQKLRTWSLQPNIGGMTQEVRLANHTIRHGDFWQLIRLDMHNVKLEHFLNECHTSLAPNKKLGLLLQQSEDRRIPFLKCRQLMSDLIHTLPHISITKSDLVKYLKDVRAQMEAYFTSELEFSKNRERIVARIFEVIFFHKVFGLQNNMIDYLSNIENIVLHERMKNVLSRNKAFCCGFFSNTNIDNPLAICVVRSFIKSLDCLQFYYSPFEALKTFSVFIDRMKKQQTTETIPELTLFLIWVRYFTLVGFSMQSKVLGMSRMKSHFIIPSSYITNSKFVELCVFYSKTRTTETMIGESKQVFQSVDISDPVDKFIEIMAGINGKINIINIVFNRLDAYLKLKDSTQQSLTDNEALSSIIEIAEDVISLCMVYIINIGEVIPCKHESLLLKEFAVLRPHKRCPQHISDVVHGIQNSTGITDICMCVNNLLKKRGDNLIKCVWDNQKKCILKEKIDTVFNTKDTFFLPRTIRILLDPSLAVDEINEKLQTRQEETEIDEEEVRTIFGDHITNRKTKLEESIMHTVKVKEIRQSKGLVCYDEFLDDEIFASIISVNESVCDVCDYTFEHETIGDEEEDGSELKTRTKKFDETSISDSMSLKSIAMSLSCTGNDMITEGAHEKAQSWKRNEQSLVTSCRTAQYLSHRLVSSESEDNKKKFMSLSSTSDDKVRLTYEEHTKSQSHQLKMKQVHDFYIHYKHELKPGLESVQNFISKYELSSDDASERYGADEIRISKLLLTFEECNDGVADMIRSKQWKRTQDVEKKLKELVKLMNNLKNSVKMLFSLTPKVSSYILDFFPMRSNFNTLLCFSSVILK